MMNVFTLIGILSSGLILYLIALYICNWINRLIECKNIKKEMSTIEKGTCLFDHERRLKIITKEDLKIKSKKVKMIDSRFMDSGLWYLKGIDGSKGWSKTELEKDFINLVGELYENDSLEGDYVNKYIDKITKY